MRNAKLFPKVAVASNVSGWFIFLKLAEGVGRWMDKGMRCTWREAGLGAAERALKASLLMAFYTVRSERRFCEQWAASCFSVSTTARSREQHVLQKSGAVDHYVAKRFLARWQSTRSNPGW